MVVATNSNITIQNSTEHAPIAVFCYRRPDHLRRTLESLMRCNGFDSSLVIVFSDGPKNSEQVEGVEQTRAIAKSLLGDRAEYHFMEKNSGLARSVIHGVEDVVGRFGRVIVIEDDLELDPAFLTYMNRALERFADDDRVWQVSGYMFDVPAFRFRSQALFLPMTVSWGWGTWRRAWKQFDLMATGWDQINSDPVVRFRFNLNGAYDYATMLNRQMTGKIDSWAIRWYWSAFKADSLTLFPPVSLVRNNGLDGSGSHGRGLFRNFRSLNYSLPVTVPSMPDYVESNQFLTCTIFNSISAANGGVLGKIVDRFKRVFR